MPVSRREFVRGLGVGAAGAFTSAFIGARGREAWAAALSGSPFVPADANEIDISSNENPIGPGQHVIDALENLLGSEGAAAGRYFFEQMQETLEHIAKSHGVPGENVVMGAGSSQILRTATDLFTTAERALVSIEPTFEMCAGLATLLGHPVVRVPVDSKFRVDLDRTARAAKGTGLVYCCNPNNPTATVHAATDVTAFLDQIETSSPGTKILLDEAYHHYVTDPAHESQLKRAVEDPGLIVARTFSKAYGMAGLRLGFAVAHRDTIEKMSGWQGDMWTNVLGRFGAVAALGDGGDYIATEKSRNETVRRLTRKFFRDAGYEDTESQANFVLVDVRRSADEFARACRERGVRIGRAFKALPNHARITMGTMEEMERAFEVFREVLGIEGTKAA